MVHFCDMVLYKCMLTDSFIENTNGIANKSFKMY